MRKRSRRSTLVDEDSDTGGLADAAASTWKDSMKTERNIETLVVVDSAMVRQHGPDNVTTYVLTILNMVRSYVNTIYSEHGKHLCDHHTIY